jgi:hypothetical protein
MASSWVRHIDTATALCSPAGRPPLSNLHVDVLLRLQRAHLQPTALQHRMSNHMAALSQTCTQALSIPVRTAPRISMTL